MSMALAGVGFSLGVDASSFEGAMARVSSKMDSVADSFAAMRDKAVGGMFTTVNKGFSATASGLSKLGGAMRKGVSAVPGKVFEMGGSFLSAGLQFTKKLGGPIMGFIAGGVGSAFSAIGDAVGGIFSGQALSSMTAGVNLTSALEGEAVSTGKSVRELGAQMGYTGKDLDKFTKKATAMSMSLNIGGAETAKALRGWDEAQDDLKALGFTSAAGFAKFTESFGVDADTLRNTTMQMRREFGLTDDQISNLVGSTAKMGQVTGDVPKALGELPEVMNRVREQASLMGVSLDGARLVEFATQTNALASGFMQMGQNSDDARAQATKFAETLIESESGFAGMFAGVQNDLPEFVKELAITTGDANKAFELMESGPAGFVQGMTSMVAEAKKSGALTDQQMNFIKLRMEKVLGKETAGTMVNFFRTADSATLKTMQITKDARNNLQDMGNEAFRTGRTMQESFDRASDAMFDRFRALGKPAARRWLKDTREAMSKFGEQVNTLGKDKGPLGAMTKKMAEASVIGAQAFVPKALRPTTMVMGQMMDKLGPTMESLKGLGINFTSVGGILSGVGTTFGLFAADMAMNKEETESWGDAAAKTVRKFGDSFATSISSVGDWLGKAADWFANFDIENIFSMGEEGKATSEFDKAIAEVKEKLGEWANPEKWVEIAGKFAKGFSSIWTWITTNETVRSTMSGMVDWVSDFLSSAVEMIDWDRIFEMIKQGASAGWDAIGGVSGIMGAMWDSTETGKNVNVGSEIIGDTVKSVANVGGFFGDMADGFSSMGEGAMGALNSIEEGAKGIFGNSVNTYAKQDMELTVEAFQDASTQILEIVNLLFMDVVGAMENMMLQTQVAAQSVVEDLKTIAALEAALSGSEAVRSKHIRPSADKERDARIAKLTSDDAVHNPLWYSGSKGYERLFNAKMDQLIAAVHTMNTSSTAPRAAVARPTMSSPAPTSRARVPSSVRG